MRSLLLNWVMYSSVVWVFFLMTTSGSDPYYGTEVEQSAFSVHNKVSIDVMLCATDSINLSSFWLM